ncbi:HAD family acid phosphatase [uncultured Jatrophihabitans sp.]|uniref:HAD family acid phosphatase n=1 Tax=uncultured Jatrophihabitans sp. TaxID=1610747 RepID=UPI0035CAD182
MRLWQSVAVFAMTLAGMCALSVPSSAATRSSVPSASHWLADVSSAMSGGTAYLDRHVGGRPAIGLDIDNTSRQTHDAAGRATPAVLAFEQRAVRDGYTIVFVTGRLRAQRSSSVAQLRRAGYRVDRMCLRAHRSTSLATAKSRCRAHYARQGLRIVADVGNHSTDFRGGHRGKVYRLPNYGGALS